jgi:hypothetical protein
MCGMSSTQIAEHYSREVDWGLLSKRQLMSVGLSFEHLAEMALTLAKVNPMAAAPSLCEWVRISGWKENASSLHSDANLVLNDYLGDLLELAPELPWQEPSSSEPKVACSELSVLPSILGKARPPGDEMLQAGMISDAWKGFVDYLRTAFGELLAECALGHTRMEIARAMLMRGLFLSLDLVYVCNLVSYSERLHSRLGAAESGT